MQFGWFARIALAAALAGGPLVLAAPPSAAQHQPSPAAVAAARELLALKGGDVFFTPFVSGVVENAKNTFLPTNPNLSNELNEVASKLRKDYEPKRTELLNEVARVYAERFSEQELKALIDFYKSPLGRKMVLEDPAIIDESVRRARTWSEALGDEVMERFRQEMKKKGHDL
jgi:uncharacterized protein